jgi:putative flippase GtrA
MKKIDLFYGIVIGIITSVIGSYIFIVVFTPYSFLGGLQIMKFDGKLGKIITLGAILNLLVFFGLLKYDKEVMARGVLLAMIIVTIVTLFV